MDSIYLHGDIKEFYKVLWTATQLIPVLIRRGCPGTMQVKVIYMLTDDNELWL